MHVVSCEMTYRAMAQHRMAMAPMSIARAELRAGEIEVRVHASAMNRADLARDAPHVGGHDFAGIVTRTASGTFVPGERVFGFVPYERGRGGAFAEYLVVEADCAQRLGAGVSALQAAAAATPGVAAIQALRDEVGIQPFERVLVIGGAGGLGALAIGVADRLGAHVTAVAGTRALAFVRALGADAVVDRDLEEVRALTTRYDAVFDCAGAYSYAQLRHLLQPDGAYVTTRRTLGGSARALISPRCRVLAVTPDAADLALLAGWLANGMRVPIAERYSIRDLVSAHERIARGGVQGRIAIDVADGF